jgi:hypothetical protein
VIMSDLAILSMRVSKPRDKATVEVILVERY